MMNCNKPVFIFINPHWVLGGVDTYFYRMICWLREREYITYLILPRKTTIDTEFYTDLKKTGTKVVKLIERYNVSNEAKPTKISLEIERDSTVYILATRLPDYLVAQQIVSCNSNNRFILINYMLHVEALLCQKVSREGTSLQNYLFFRLVYRYYRYVFSKSTVIVMDDICRKAYESFYNIKIEDKDIIPLGIEIDEYHEDAHVKKNEFVILTVCRYEIPYKGYILGLIEQFNQLCLKYDNLKLQIIGWGSGEDKVKKQIQIQPNKTKEKIELIGKVEYKVLTNYFNKASIYVGMGTTLIDAGRCGIPGIAVDFFTEESVSNQLFCDNPEVVASIHRVPTSDLIEKIINYSPEEYQNCCYNTYQMVQKVYSLDSVMNRILDGHYSDRQYRMSHIELWIQEKVTKIVLRCFHSQENHVAWVDRKEEQ